MMAEIVNFYKHWKNKQEIARKSLGYSADLWYAMLDNGYEPSDPISAEKFLEDLEKDE